MPLQIPNYQLEEILDVHLKAPNADKGYFKVRLLSIIENESVDKYSGLSPNWLTTIGFDKTQLPFYEEELFYVGELMKPFNEFKRGDLLLIPESWIDRELTRLSQEEPTTIVFDFNFDYGNKAFTGIEDIIEKVTEFIYEKSFLEVDGRKVIRYEETDLKAIMTLLKVYYKVEDTQYNRDSVKNVLCSAASRQIVTSKSTNKKIEIYVDSSIRNKLICTVYNKKNKEMKEFYF